MARTKIHIQFLKTERGLIKKDKELLEEIIKDHAGKAGSILNVPMVNITIYSNPGFTIPETGEGGYAPSKDWFHIYIDATKKKEELNKIIKNIIPATIYHEMNHVSRWKNTGYGLNLPDVIVTEGLATVFAKEQWKKYKAPWNNYSKKEFRKLLSLFKKRKKNDDKKYNHEEWFYGTGKLPRWAGYKLGSYIIQSFRKNNKNINWKEILKMSTKEIIKKSRVDLA
jgi:uncharacterized protein YjaZ